MLGCGRSSSWLIKYLFEHNNSLNLKITISDYYNDFPFNEVPLPSNTNYIRGDLSDIQVLASLIEPSDLVISLLPPTMHFLIAEQCLHFKKHFITASYVTDEIRNLHSKAKEKNIIMMMEAGLDPGLDHISALKEIQSIQDSGGIIDSFKSYTGGLVAPESDDNPWHYKISWNPRNVVLAGQGNMSRYLENGIVKCIPYHRLFAYSTPINVFKENDFEGYINRDSLKYQTIYGLESATTLIRGTIRQKDFCDGWQQLVYLGMTDDSTKISNSHGMAMKDFTQLFLTNYHLESSLESNICNFLSISPLITAFSQLDYLGFFGDDKIDIENGTPAQIIQERLIKKIPLQPTDKDMIVMQHELQYALKNERRVRKSTLICKGKNSIYTAMAKTVGLPLGIICKLIIEGKIAERGVMLPVKKYIYDYVLEEIKIFDIAFQTTDNLIK